MRSWSLVCFTLLTQSAIGLTWVSVAARWFGSSHSGPIPDVSLIAVLILTAIGLMMALAHLAKPQKAPHAVRNVAVSWLSREILLVHAFAGAVALLLLLLMLGVRSGQVVLETAACLSGGAALYAMTRVYLVRTVPVWNSPATALEFTGSVLVLGGAVKCSIAFPGFAAGTGFGTQMTVAAIAIGMGVVMKMAALKPALAAQGAARSKSWYETKAAPLSFRSIFAARMLLNLFGLLLFAFSWAEAAWLWSLCSLACFAAAEVIGRNQFYRSYQRMGL